MNARPRGWLSRHWTIHDDDGRSIELDLGLWREGAELDLGGERYSFERKGMLSGELLLRRGDELLARATRASIWRSGFTVDTGGEQLVMARASWWRRSFEIRRGAEVVGSIERHGWLDRHCSIDLPADWPLALRVFVFWLALVLWKREAAAAAAT